MSDMKKNINDGKDVLIDNGNVTVINNVSIAEKEEQKVAEPAASVPVSESVITSDENKTIVPEEVPVQSQVDSVEAGETQFAGIPTAPIDLPGQTVFPGFAPDFNASQSEYNSTTIENQVHEDEISGKQNLLPFGEIKNGLSEKSESSANFLTTGVYKNTSDVDLAEEKFLDDVKLAYDKNIANPTKKIVELLNDFKGWGNNVTSQGLNRQLFEEFDELCRRYDGLPVAEYGDDSPYIDNQNNQNFGGMNY